MSRIADLVFWAIVLAIVFMLVRPKSRAGSAVIALADALAAMIATVTGAAAAGGNTEGTG
jgi:hypothetical protein